MSETNTCEGARSRSFVFATLGDGGNNLARRAARTLRLAMPDAVIDWLTETAFEDPVFDKTNLLEKSLFRPKSGGAASLAVRT